MTHRCTPTSHGSSGCCPLPVSTFWESSRLYPEPLTSGLHPQSLPGEFAFWSSPVPWLWPSQISTSGDQVCTQPQTSVHEPRRSLSCWLQLAPFPCSQLSPWLWPLRICDYPPCLKLWT